jgi:acyl-CoA synthetase (AMP-forming)/AMP-acid ligase II
MHKVPTNFRTILDALDYHVMAGGEKVVLRRLGFRGKSNDEITAAKLREDALQFAHNLSAISSCNDRILLAYPSCNTFLVAFLGCLYAGRIAVPVSIGTNKHSGERISVIAHDCKAAILISPDLNVASLTGAWGTESACRLVAHETLTGLCEQATLSACSSDDICFLQYTSGSTGIPKGVIITHDNLVVNLTQIMHAIGHDPTIVSWLPQFHDMGLIGTMLLPVYAGTETTYMSPLEFVQRPIRWLQALSDYRAHFSVAPNFGFSYLLERLRPGELDGIDLSSVSNILCGSEPINYSVLEAFSEALKPFGLSPHALMPTYGLAEATLMVSAHPRGELPRIHKSYTETRQILTHVSCGYPAVGMDIKIIGPVGEGCPNGTEGEIAISGPNVSNSYWGKASHQGALPTGDLGFVWNGELFVTGRKKDLIIFRGRNFHPVDIEAISEAMTPNAGANSCVAIGVSDPDGVEFLVVAQEIASATMREVDQAELRSKITNAIVDNFSIAPSDVLLLKRNILPRTTSGKISRIAFKAALVSGQIVETFPKL